MIQRYLPTDSFVDPAGLSMLGSAFDEICLQHGIEAESQQAVALAGVLLRHYQAGIHDREKLLAMAGNADQSLFGGAN
ncbi:hypothetical protein [Mycoplana rhizolycopersici]|uniref:Uncharacterized protein n=1 Tax=Mycoplana rhizolycopersici TaxID=2746702 RepID=A0ABX2QKP6_9HYPH|nr:hypothetical protein [Rhizobium rhizolycopersici]NVP58359.1 hypothetical protein [Rhizobium rhizolycopersici]